MYILAALLIALPAYAVAVILLRRRRSGAASLVSMSVTSLVVFAGLLAAYISLSAAIGIDVGPGHPVSYSIPGDYTAAGAVGVGVLALLVLAGLAPLFGLGVAARRR